MKEETFMADYFDENEGAYTYVLFDTDSGDTSCSIAPDKSAHLCVTFDEQPETTSFIFDIEDVDVYVDKLLFDIDTKHLLKALGAESYDEASNKLKDLISEHDFRGPLFKIKEFLDSNNITAESQDTTVPRDEF
ncbi:MAG: hypothetical protein J6X10_01245 [Bacteroidales bacterium]|nr:hypothetical protein [Bacteroidales bacterium]